MKNEDAPSTPRRPISKLPVLMTEIQFRDWIAVHAMAGLLNGVEIPREDIIAAMSYKMADAVIAARKGNS